MKPRPLNGKHLNCGGAKSTMTHNSREPKGMIPVQWNPPANYTGKVKIVATVVQHFSTYWVKLSSPVVTVGDPSSTSSAKDVQINQGILAFVALVIFNKI